MILNGKKHNLDYSNEAIEYTNKVFYELGQTTDEEEKLEYRKSINYQLMGQLDSQVMDKIVEYFKGL